MRVAPIVLRDGGGFFSSVPGPTLTRMAVTPHEHHSAPPPHRDDCIPPLQQQAPGVGVTTARKAVPCWVDLEYPGRRRETYPAFAEAWTSELVYVQWVEQSEGRRAWVNASQCRRRQLRSKSR